MTVDAEDCLWVAMWGAGTVRRYHPDGRLLTTQTVPAPHPTSVCLHPDGHRLLVTTARYGVTRADVRGDTRPDSQGVQAVPPLGR